MSNVNNIDQTYGTAAVNGASSERNTSGVLGKDDFLKLLVAQLKNQDPLAPTNDNEWMGQMAQFSALEQQSNTAADTARIAEHLGHAGALGLIGRTVTYTDSEDESHTGVVEQVDMGSDGKATLTVDGTPGIEASAVTQVK